MISSWRRRRAARHAGKTHDPADENSSMELTIPTHFRCPISLDVMKDPVTLSTGITYDRTSIETWIEGGNITCPITNQVLRNLEPIPNHSIRKMIQDWCVENRAHGIERIPTPRIPITSIEVSEMLFKIMTACKRRDRESCREMVVKIKRLMRESERNRRCIVNNGTANVLSTIFESFAKDCLEENVNVLEETLSTLTLMVSFDGETKSHLGSPPSLHSMMWFLKNGDLSSRRNAILGLKEVLSDQERLNSFVEIEGSIEAIVKLIKEPICPTTTKASLMTLYYMVSSNERIIPRFAEMGLVAILLEMLVESERSVCEKALGVLDGLCESEEGREKAYEHALTMPVLVKKILRVSDLATEFSVSILWKLGKNEEREDGGSVLVEALQVGAFQKLLLLLQVGCGDRTKEKATELLKLLNLHRDRLECIESMDFKDLKRPF